MKNTYNIEKLFSENLHIHSNYSTCSNSEMSIETIIQVAEKSNLKRIAITDHHHTYDETVLANIKRMRDIVKKINPSLTVLVGAELSAYGVDKFTDPIEMNKQIEYRLYATNHYHLKFWEQPSEITPRAFVSHNYEIMKSLILSNRADCIAHPFYFRYVSDKFSDVTAITKELRDTELEEICKLSVEHGVAWEISEPMIDLDPAFVKRLWNVGKSCGLIFNIGTDSHNVNTISTECFKYKFLKIIK